VCYRYEVGFDPALAQIISEVKYLDQLGFDVPPDAKTIALLEDQYVLRVSALKQMLKSFYDVLDVLDPSQVNYYYYYYYYYYYLVPNGQDVLCSRCWADA